MWLLLLVDAYAQEDVIVLPPVDDLPSVMTTYDETDVALVRGRFGLRPIASLVFTTDDPEFGARLGASVMHHWWTVPKRGLTWSGETGVTGAGIVGGLGGWNAELYSVAGPWLGPLSLRLGPVLSGDRLVSSSGRLDDAMLIGGRVSAHLDAGVVGLWADVTPAWSVVGARSAWRNGLTQLQVGGGVAARVPVGILQMQVGAGSRARLTAIGPVVDVHLVLHMKIGGLP